MSYTKQHQKYIGHNIARPSTRNKTLPSSSPVRLAGRGFDRWPVQKSKRLRPKSVKMETNASLVGTQYSRLDLGGEVAQYLLTTPSRLMGETCRTNFEPSRM